MGRAAIFEEGYCHREHGVHRGSISLPGQKPASLPEEFYRHDPAQVARGLLGKVLIRKLDGHALIGRIVETEAYLGEGDPASHSFPGLTSRNSVLFGPPGRAYVYFIYGMHYCLNVSCEPDGKAGGVLFRALEPVAGMAEMARLRKLAPDVSGRLLTSGPGRLCQALGITRENINGVDLTDAKSVLYIADDGYVPKGVTLTPRIGISKASDRPLRFVISENRFVSGSFPRRLSSTS
jgi:DNA-3-methyladenine glycosylase